MLDHTRTKKTSEIILDDTHKAHHDYTVRRCGASSQETGEAQEARRRHGGTDIYIHNIYRRQQQQKGEKNVHLITVTHAHGAYKDEFVFFCFFYIYEATAVRKLPCS